MNSKEFIECRLAGMTDIDIIKALEWKEDLIKNVHGITESTRIISKNLEKADK